MFMMLRSNQLEILASLLLANSTHNRYTIKAIMRSGKTRPVLQFLIESKFNKVLWIIDNVKEKGEIQNECNIINNPDYYKNLTLVHPVSISNIDIKEYDITIFNECQNITENIYNVIKDSKIIVGLTGTYPYYNETKLNLLQKLGLDNIIYDYSLNDGIEDNIVSDLSIFVTNLKDCTLDWKVKNRIKNISIIDLQIEVINVQISINQEEIDKFGDYKDCSLEDKNKLKELYNKNRILRNSLTPFYEDKKNNSMFLQRSLNSLSCLVEFAKDLINKHKDKSILIFCSSAKQSKEITKYNYNDKTTDEYLDKFNNNEINHLALVKKAGTGYTFKRPIDVIILLDVNSNMMQKIGRGLINNKSDNLKVIIPYVIEQQLKWIEKSFIEIDSDKIQYL